MAAVSRAVQRCLTQVIYCIHLHKTTTHWQERSANICCTNQQLCLPELYSKKYSSNIYSFTDLTCIYSSAVKWLIVINRIQNKSFCLHNICVCTVYIYYAYINTHTYSIYFENIYMYLHVYIYIHILYIIYKYIYYMSITYFLKCIHACVCIYIYIINIHSTHTYIM